METLAALLESKYGLHNGWSTHALRDCDPVAIRNLLAAARQHNVDVDDSSIRALFTDAVNADEIVANTENTEECKNNMKAIKHESRAGIHRVRNSCHTLRNTDENAVCPVVAVIRNQLDNALGKIFVLLEQLDELAVAPKLAPSARVTVRRLQLVCTTQQKNLKDAHQALDEEDAS